MNINSNILFNNITTSLGVIVLATMINVILFAVLPKYGIDKEKKANNTVEFLNYDKLYKFKQIYSKWHELT